MWAFGCTIYELATRSKAFSAKSIAGLVNMICKGDPPQIADDEDELSQLISSMLIKDPTKRPTMRELRDMYKDVFEHHEENWEKLRGDFEKRRVEGLKDAKHLTRTMTEVPTIRNRAYKEENLKEIIANYKQEEILRHEIHLKRPESKRRDSNDSADLMSKRSWYGLRRVHLFGRGIPRPRWLCQHLLSRLKSIQGDPAGYTRFALSDHGCVVASGQCDTDGLPNGRSLGSWNWYNKRADRGNVSRYPRDVSRATRFRTSPPMCFFGDPIDLEQMRMDVNALNFDPSSRRRVGAATEDENEDSSDDEEFEDTTITFEDEWINEMWFVHRKMMKTALHQIMMNRSSSIETQLKRRVKSLRSSLRSRHHDLILTLRRQEMKFLKLNKDTIEDMRLEVDALETLFEESKRVVDDEHIQVEPLLAKEVFCGPTITFVST